MDQRMGNCIARRTQLLSPRKLQASCELSRYVVLEEGHCKGDVFNWTWFGIHSAAGESRLAAPIKGLNTVGTVAGRVFPIVNGTMTGLESLRSDDINHPEMGDGEKVVRATIKGITTAGVELIGGGAGAYAGGLVGITLGGPIGAVIGNVGGG